MKRRGQARGRSKRPQGGDLAALLADAETRHRAGDIQGADHGYRAVVSRDPRHAAAWHGYGILALQLGLEGPAVERLQRAVKLDSTRPEYHSNLGAALEASGDLEGAERAYSGALGIAARDVDALFNRGLVRARRGREVDALADFARAASLAPGDAEIHLNVARIHRRLGKLDAAAAAAERASALAPADAPAAAELGAIATARGRATDAVEHYREALRRDPTGAGYATNLGAAWHAAGDPGAAEAAYRRALEIAPVLREARFNLGGLLEASGRFSAALVEYRALLATAPEDPVARRCLARTLRRAVPSEWDEAFADLLRRLLTDDRLDPQDLAAAAAAQLRTHPAVAAGGERLDPTTLPRPARALATAFLVRAVNTDPRLETLLIGWRRALVRRLRERPDAVTVELAAALALQAFSSEHIWPSSPEEEAQGEAALETLALRLADGGDPVPDLLVAGLHRTLAGTPIAAAIVAGGPDRWPPAVRPLVERAVQEPADEAALIGDLERLVPIRDETSRRVRVQYLENPYPRWIGLPPERERTLAQVLARRFPGTDTSRLDGRFDGLVAGGGTGQEPLRFAAISPGAAFTVLDLSETSLAYAVRMSRRLGIEGIRFVHGDLLDCTRLDQRFDLVVATGVLHHLADPERGWARLCEMLAPGGFMKVGLYSRAAREVVRQARALIAGLGLGSTAREVRDFRTRLLAGEWPELSALADSEDLHTTSGCRDLLFHVCEHQFDLKEIAAIIERLGLSLLGLEIDSPPSHAAPRLDDLASWDRVEAERPATFAGMYQIWLQRD